MKIGFTCALVAAFGLGAAGASMMRAQMPTAEADRYIADCIDLFERHGWDWTYHAFREWDGWSVERAYPDGPGTKPVPSADNPRMRALKAGLRRK